MVNKNNINNYFPLVFAAIFLILAISLHSRFSRPEIVISKQQSAINVNQSLVRFMSLGNKRLISDLIWIQTLLEADHEHYSKHDLGSWMYLRFLTISELDPLFYENYIWGGMFLSIVKDDVEGAADIFERGLRHYPNDFRLNFSAGFNYYFEMGEYEKGRKTFEKIENHPSAPTGLKFILNKLRFETSGNYESTMAFLNYQYENSNDPAIQAKMKTDIYALKAERDLECLNAGKDNCERLDAEGERYIYRDGHWKAVREFKPYRIYRKK